VSDGSDKMEEGYGPGDQSADDGRGQEVAAQERSKYIYRPPVNI
jgi:hypothetical protein